MGERRALCAHRMSINTGAFSRKHQDREELQKLVAEGKEKGFLSYDEIATGLEDVELTKEQVEDFYTVLTEQNIDLVEG